IPGRMDEVRDVAPPRSVLVGDRQRVAEHPPLAAQPGRGELRGRQLTMQTSGAVDPGLETVHGDLAEDAGDDVLDASAEEGQPCRGVLLRAEDATERHRLAEYRGRLGEGE